MKWNEMKGWIGINNSWMGFDNNNNQIVSRSTAFNNNNYSQINNQSNII
jgi:hypothetical protein